MDDRNSWKRASYQHVKSQNIASTSTTDYGLNRTRSSSTGYMYEESASVPSPHSKRRISRSNSRPYRNPRDDIDPDLEPTYFRTSKDNISLEETSSFSSLKVDIISSSKTSVNTDDNVLPSGSCSNFQVNSNFTLNSQKPSQDEYTKNSQRKGKKKKSKGSPLVTLSNKEKETDISDCIIDLDQDEDCKSEEDSKGYPNAHMKFQSTSQTHTTDEVDIAKDIATEKKNETGDTDDISISSFASFTSCTSQLSQTSVSSKKKQGFSGRLKKGVSKLFSRNKPKKSKTSASTESLQSIKEAMSTVESLIHAINSQILTIPQEVIKQMKDVQCSNFDKNQFQLHSENIIPDDICEEIFELTAELCATKRESFIKYMMTCDSNHSSFSKEFVQKVLNTNEERYQSRDDRTKVFKFLYEWKTHYAAVEQKRTRVILDVLKKAVKKVNADHSLFEKCVKEILAQNNLEDVAIIDEVFLYNLASMIDDVLLIGLQLGIGNHEIRRLKVDNPGDSLQVTFRTLLLWRQRACGTELQLKGALMLALTKAGRKDLAQKIDKAKY